MTKSIDAIIQYARTTRLHAHDSYKNGYSMFEPGYESRAKVVTFEQIGCYLVDNLRCIQRQLVKLSLIPKTQSLDLQYPATDKMARRTLTSTGSSIISKSTPSFSSSDSRRTIGESPVGAGAFARCLTAIGSIATHHSLQPVIQTIETALREALWAHYKLLQAKCLLSVDDFKRLLFLTFGRPENYTGSSKDADGTFGGDFPETIDLYQNLLKTLADDPIALADKFPRTGYRCDARKLIYFLTNRPELKAELDYKTAFKKANYLQILPNYSEREAQRLTLGSVAAVQEYLFYNLQKAQQFYAHFPSTPREGQNFNSIAFATFWNTLLEIQNMPVTIEKDSETVSSPSCSSTPSTDYARPTPHHVTINKGQEAIIEILWAYKILSTAHAPTGANTLAKSPKASPGTINFYKDLLTQLIIRPRDLASKFPDSGVGCDAKKIIYSITRDDTLEDQMKCPTWFNNAWYAIDLAATLKLQESNALCDHIRQIKHEQRLQSEAVRLSQRQRSTSFVVSKAPSQTTLSKARSTLNTSQIPQTMPILSDTPTHEDEHTFIYSRSAPTTPSLQIGQTVFRQSPSLIPGPSSSTDSFGSVELGGSPSDTIFSFG